MTDEKLKMDGSAFPQPGSDDWLEQLLRLDAADTDHISDGGFSARVMQALPIASRRGPISRWLPAGTLVGSIALLALTPAGSQLMQAMISLAHLHGSPTTALLLLIPVVAPLLALYTPTVMEALDR